MQIIKKTIMYDSYDEFQFGIYDLENEGYEVTTVQAYSNGKIKVDCKLIVKK